MASEKSMQILEEIKTLTILELADLVKALEEEFGVSAAAEQRADLVSDVPFALFFDLAADCLDDARSFQSEIIRPTGRGRILSGALKKIGAVDACGVNFKQDFVVMYLRHGNFGPVQMTVCSVQHCIHRITSCVICGETSPFLQSIHLF